MRSNGPVLLALPAFRGLTRRLILIAIGCFVFFFVLGLVSHDLAGTVLNLLRLHADDAPHLPWQFVTYPFMPEGFLGLLFALLSLWYFGSALEDERGPRWFGEVFFTSYIVGGLVACLISHVLGRFVPYIDPVGKFSNGLWPAVLALLVAFACLHPDEPLNFNFIFRARAKYIAAIMLLVYVAMDIYIVKRFDALVALCAAGSAWMFVRFVPVRGLRYAVSEGLYGVRNRYYRARRRRAAKKFTVYMRKQGKDVSIDASGRYIGLDDDDPGDRRRMN